jgi:hypothetical protein
MPPVISNVGANTFQANVVPDGNPTGTYYAFQVIYQGTGGWIDATGIITPVPTWMTVTQIKVVGITPGTNYSVRLQAAVDNIGTNATAFGTVTSFTSLTGVTSQFASTFTIPEQQLIDGARKLMPEIFSRNTPDFKILAYANLIISDINLFPPFSGLTPASVATDPNLQNLVYFGISLMTELFLQARATLEDFQYNDNGLSLNVDQVGKISQSYASMLEFYRQMIINYKKTQIFAVGAVGLGTPRYQSQIGQFLKISLGCFLDTIRVLTSCGYMKLADVKVGMKVLSADGKFHRIYDKISRNISENMYDVRVGERILKMTGNHEVLLSDGNWVSAENLKIGDICLVGINLVPQPITSINTFKYTGKVYDLSVEGKHSYNADGVIVHNSAFSWNAP